MSSQLTATGRRRRARGTAALVLLLLLLGIVPAVPGLTAVASARVEVLQARSLGPIALTGAASAVVAPAQQRIELVAPGLPPRVLAPGPGEPTTSGATGEDFTQTLLRFAASPQALAYESASQASYRAGPLGLTAVSGFGPLAGPYSTFPGSGSTACAARYPDDAFLPEGASTAMLPSGAFTVSGTRLASWPACANANAIAVRDLSTPGTEVTVALPQIAPAGGAPDEVAQIALEGEALAALVGVSNPHGVYPLPPYAVVVANAVTGVPMYTSPVLPAAGPLAVSAAGTAVVQLPSASPGAGSQASAYVISQASPAPRLITSGCVSAYGVAIAAERVAQAVCGAGIVTTNLAGGEPATVLALGAVPAEAFGYDGEASAAVRPACDGEDELELGGGARDTEAALSPACPAAFAGTRASLHGGRVAVRLRCAAGCAGTLTLAHGRTHASAQFALGPGQGFVSVRAPRPLLAAARAARGATFAVTLAVRTLTGAKRLVHGALHVRG
jgi:hypothetical protein